MTGQLRLRVALFVRDLKERALFDYRLTKTLACMVSLLIGVAHLLFGRRMQGAEALARVHRADLSKVADRIIEHLFRVALTKENPGRIGRELRDALLEYPSTIRPQASTEPFHRNPEKLLGGCIIVLKSPSDGERGVLYLYYSYVYPMLLRYFDFQSIRLKYHIIIEPSWSGYCDLNILCLNMPNQPVFVCSIEPRDTAFLHGMHASFVPVHVGANAWVDTDIFRPLEGVEKDIDIIYIASWARYKRHWAVFRALSVLRKRGVHPRVALVGYSIDMTKEDVRAQARFYGVDDMVELHERLTPTEVNRILNRSKVNLLWSRREGVNRAIIEGMAAGVPCVLRSGFNYGYQYPHINEHTGIFASERELPDILMRMFSEHVRYSPRDYVLSEMTPEVSTLRLNTAIKRSVEQSGERWSRNIATKATTLDGLGYKFPGDPPRFDEDYRFLKSRVLPRP